MVEVLHRIGQVQRGAIDSQLGQGTIQQLAGRAGEWLAAQILDVARLLADHHDRGIGRAFTEHPLRGRFPQRALAAGQRLLAQCLQSLGVGGGHWRQRPRRYLPLRCLRGPVMHFLHAIARIAHQARQQLRLGQVAPVLGRHLLHHHPGIEPGRIEDAGVIGLPQRLPCILCRGVLAPCAGAEGQRLSIPCHAA